MAKYIQYTDGRTLTLVSTRHREFDKMQLYKSSVPMPGVYLYGEIAQWAGYYTVKCVNHCEFGVAEYMGVDGATEMKCIDMADGVYKCNVRGYRRNAVAYIWHKDVGGVQRICGFVVDVHDEKSVERACAEYEKFSRAPKQKCISPL